MSFRKNTVLIFCILFLEPHLFSDAKPTKEQVVRYYKITNFYEKMRDYSKSYLDVMKSTYSNLDDDFYSDSDVIKILKEYEDEYIQLCINVTRENINKKELDKLILFLESDLGKRFIELDKKTAPIFIDIGTKVNINLNRKILPFIKKYLN